MQDSPAKTFRLGESDYPVDALGPEGQAALKHYLQTSEHIQYLGNMTAILNRAKNGYIADLKQEIVRNKSGFDLSDMFSDD